jgi:hypothetical protein
MKLLRGLRRLDLRRKGRERRRLGYRRNTGLRRRSR